MSRWLILAFSLATAAPGCTQEKYYRSDEMGMLLAPVTAFLRDDSRWIVGVIHSGSGEDRRLYDDGKEVRRWETGWNAGGTQRIERESANGALKARRIYDKGGALQREEEYAAGKLDRIRLFAYAGGRLRTRRELDSNGTELAVDTFRYADNGSLREVRHVRSGAAAEVTTSVAGWSGLAEQRSRTDGWLLVEHYDSRGRLLRGQKTAVDAASSVEEFFYDPTSSALASSRESGNPESPVVERRYDQSGQVVQETTSLKGSVTGTTTYVRDAKGRVTIRTRRGAPGIETWRYDYTESGDLQREEYWQRGVRVKITVYGKAKTRTEELYRDGELFLKVTYDGDTKVREEVFDNGVLVRTRDYP